MMQSQTWGLIAGAQPTLENILRILSARTSRRIVLLKAGEISGAGKYVFKILFLYFQLIFLGKNTLWTLSHVMLTITL